MAEQNDDARRAVAELRAQREAVGRVHDSMAEAIVGRLATAQPAGWRSPAAHAYADRLDQTREQAKRAMHALTSAEKVVTGDIRRAVDQIPASSGFAEAGS